MSGLTLEHITEATQLRVIYNMTCTPPESKDPGQIVVKRSLLAEILTDLTGQQIHLKVLNQLVLNYSRTNPRKQITVKSASRRKYLFVKPALCFLDYVIGQHKVHPDIIAEAKLQYTLQSLEGKIHVKKRGKPNNA